MHYILLLFIFLSIFLFLAGGKDGNASKRRRLPEMSDRGDGSSGPGAMSKTEEKVVVEAIEEEEKVEEGQEDALKSDDKKEKEKDKVIEKPIDPTMHILEPEEEDEMWEKVNERKMGYTMPPRPARGSQVNFDLFIYFFHQFVVFL